MGKAQLGQPSQPLDRSVKEFSIKNYLLSFIFVLLILANSACTDTSEQMQLTDMIGELADLADSGRICLEGNSVEDPVVSYDLLETDSLITPIVGIIEVETKEILSTSADGTSLLTFRHHFKLTYAYEEGEWTPLEMEVIYGRPAPDKDRVNDCFQ